MPTRVLIVDDERNLGVIMKKSLPKTWDIVFEMSAASALERLLGGEEFDVILLDIMIPTMTGIEAFRTLAEKKPDLCSRVVFMTGGRYIPAVEAFLSTVPNAVLEKPFLIEEVVSAVRTLTRRLGLNGSKSQ